MSAREGGNGLEHYIRGPGEGFVDEAGVGLGLAQVHDINQRPDSKQWTKAVL